MKLLLDANVLLDTALRRAPFAADSDRVIQWCQEHPHAGLVAWHSVANIYYFLRVAWTNAKAREFIADLLRFAIVAETGSAAVRQALSLPMSDFEDALQVAAALAGEADFIVTRDTRDFRQSPLRVMTPPQFLREMEIA